MACFGCGQQIDFNHAEKKRIIKEAQALANKTGEWVILYTDGELRYIIESEAKRNSINPEGFVTPELQDNNVRDVHRNNDGTTIGTLG